MALNKEEYPEREFWGRQVSFSAQDCETLFYLVEESSLPFELKERFCNKLRGYFLSPETEQRSRRMLESRAKKMRKR